MPPYISIHLFVFVPRFRLQLLKKLLTTGCRCRDRVETQNLLPRRWLCEYTDDILLLSLFHFRLSYDRTFLPAPTTR